VVNAARYHFLIFARRDPVLFVVLPRPCALGRFWVRFVCARASRAVGAGPFGMLRVFRHELGLAAERLQEALLDAVIVNMLVVVIGTLGAHALFDL